MEGWLNLRNELALHEAQIVQASERDNGSVFDPDFSFVECGYDESMNRLRGIFDQVLVIFLKEISAKKCIRPLPVLSPDGQPVDLFKLFWVVKKVGGYDLVSRRNLWGFVVEECGLGFAAIASVKLIYVKYLNDLDRWLRKGFRESSLEDGGNRGVKKLELLVQDLEKQYRGLFDEGQKGGNEVIKFDKTRNEIGSGHTRRLLHGSSSRDTNEVHDYAEKEVDDDGKLYLENVNDLFRSPNLVIQKIFKEAHAFSKQKTCLDEKYLCSQDENGVILSAEKVIQKPISRVYDSTESIPNSNEEEMYAEISNHVRSSMENVIGKVLDSRKRKRESSLLSEMLDWLLYVARHCDDPAVGSMPECSKWKDQGKEEFWFQVLLAREALMIKRPVNSNVEPSPHQNKFRMHPSMYEDVLNHQSRCRKRLPVAKSHSCSCCNSVPQTKIASPQKADAGNCPKEPPFLNVELSAGYKTDHLSMEEPFEKQVSVGPLFQAEVPEWTGEVFESDSKWLGERMWPPEEPKDKTVIDLDPIGKGRPLICNCLFPETTECIRFHIAEKRLKLKRELGSLFYKWRFNHMGEEVSLSWTREEEDKFKDMIRLNSGSPNKFWDNASKLFPSKTREKLVSYYFNVFLIERRNYQNRVTPKDIDSDDDEKEFGSVGDRFGYKAIYVPQSRLQICFENKHCGDLE